LRTVDAHNGGTDAKKKAINGLYDIGLRFASFDAMKDPDTHQCERLYPYPDSDSHQSKRSADAYPQHWSDRNKTSICTSHS
jgi:hypothetical protein